MMGVSLVWSLDDLAQATIDAVSQRRIVMVGADAFGTCTALNLARSGADVTLIKAWHAGHTRFASRKTADHPA